jgi:hypothetical protein
MIGCPDPDGVISRNSTVRISLFQTNKLIDQYHQYIPRVETEGWFSNRGTPTAI